LTLSLAGGARVEGAGESLQLNESNRAEEMGRDDEPSGTTRATNSHDWYSRMEAELAGGRVNLSCLDANGEIALRAIDAKLVAMVSLGWEQRGNGQRGGGRGQLMDEGNGEEELSILSAPAATPNGQERELSIVMANPATAYQSVKGRRGIIQ
jgi:hypothetical protein